MQNNAQAQPLPNHAPARPVRMGPYTVFQGLGRGGMAELSLARGACGELVVIKQLADALRERGRYVDLLAAEARLSAAMDHPHIARVVGSGRCEDAQPYIALEWVEGLDLRQLLRSCTTRKIGLPIAHALAIMTAVLSALDHAHAARDERGDQLGVVHRDVSPSNVLLGFDGSVKLCDFGIATATCMPEAPVDEIEGKAGYMSPEQARGSQVDHRADLYAVGIMLWEMLCGRRMYRATGGDPLLVVAQRVKPSMLVVRGLPREAELHAIVYRALSPQREQRHDTAAAMLRELQAYRERSGLNSSPADLSEWLASNFDDMVVQLRATRERLSDAPEPSPLPRTSHIRRVAPAPALSPAPSTDHPELLATASIACAFTLALLTALSAWGLL